MRHVTGTAAEMAAYEAVCRKALGLPLRGTDVGGGRHVTHSPAPPGPGWTHAWSELTEHPAKKGLFACAALSPEAKHLETLSASEATELAEKYEDAIELDSSWEAKAMTPAVGPRVG